MWYRPAVRRIPIGLTDSQHARLGREAARRHVSVGALVREAVDATFPEDRPAHRLGVRIRMPDRPKNGRSDNNLVGG